MKYLAPSSSGLQKYILKNFQNPPTSLPTYLMYTPQIPDSKNKSYNFVTTYFIT